MRTSHIMRPIRASEAAREYSAAGLCAICNMRCDHGVVRFFHPWCEDTLPIWMER